MTLFIDSNQAFEIASFLQEVDNFMAHGHRVGDHLQQALLYASEGLSAQKVADKIASFNGWYL